MLQGLSVDRALYRHLFGVDPIDEHAAIWQALCEREWAAITDERITVVGDGGFYIPMIQGLFAAGRLEEMRRARGGRPDAEQTVLEQVSRSLPGDHLEYVRLGLGRSRADTLSCNDGGRRRCREHGQNAEGSADSVD